MSLMCRQLPIRQKPIDSDYLGLLRNLRVARKTNVFFSKDCVVKILFISWCFCLIYSLLILIIKDGKQI